MKKDVILYHDGCNICYSVVDAVSEFVDHARFNLTVINLEQHKQYSARAEASGVRKTPSLVFADRVLEFEPHALVTEFRA